MNSMMKTLKIAYKVVDYLEKYLIANAERKIVLTNQRQKMKKYFVAIHAGITNSLELVHFLLI